MTATPATSDAFSAGEDAALERLLTAFRVLQLHHARLLHQECATRGLNNTDIRVVFFLASAGLAGMTPKQASDALELSTGAMTSVIDRLEARGHLVRRPNPEDRRSVFLHLTTSGQDIVHDIGDVYRTAFRDTIPSDLVLPLALAFDQLALALGQNVAAGDQDADPAALGLLGDAMRRAA